MKSSEPDSEMEQLRRRIDAWRRTRSERGPLPEGLWRQASLLVPGRSLSKVATSLGLGYYSLHERVRRANPSTVASGFVELSWSPLVTSTLSSATGTVIEVRAPDGSLLTLRLAPGAMADVADLVERFRTARS